MASDTVSERNDEADLALAWSGRWTLTYRILAVNVLTLAVFALSVLYLDAYREQLRAERIHRLVSQALMMERTLPMLDASERDDLLRRVGKDTRARFRLYGPDGRLVEDSWRGAEPTYRLRDPAIEPWRKDLARATDRAFNRLVGEKPLDDYVEPARDIASAWPEIVAARRGDRVVPYERQAADLTPIYSAATPLPGGSSLLVTTNDRNFTLTVRSQRRALVGAIALTTLLAVLLSQFLARTIVKPLRRIALAAHRVRLGRARQVRVPRLPSRRDESGRLARAVSDMSQSLRHRIDNIEAFAADVTHELKNPLASLRSAVDSLERVERPELRRQLLDVVRQDVLRLDRLIGDVSEAARTDAELARARFEPVDLGQLIGPLVKSLESRRTTGDVRIAFARPRKGSTLVLGVPSRLARAIDNIVDNAISFSPPGGEKLTALSTILSIARASRPGSPRTTALSFLGRA
jgi:two-component system sensor histidine kinase ChvG